jgi:UPF0755 protein
MAGPPPVPGGGRSEEERERARLEREARRQGVVAPRTAAGQQPKEPKQPKPPKQPRSTRPSSGNHRRVSELRTARQHRQPRDPGARRPARQPGSSTARRRIFVAVFGVLFVFVLWFLFSLFQPFAGSGGKKRTVTIKAKSGLDGIAKTLTKEHIVSSEFFFKLRATVSGHRSDLKPGTYTLREDSSYEDVLTTLSKGVVVKTVNVTVPEGRARTELKDIVDQAGLDGSYTAATKKSRLLDPADYGGKKAKNLEGFLFPATYTLKAGSTVKDLVDKQLTAFKQNFAGVSLRSAKRKNLNGYDVLTIASLIEREAQVPRERKLVASVIYNRLKAGMPLQIDASIRFATNNWQKPIKASDLRLDTPYNTYRFKGLPPGPIASPGLASIRAAAKPASTDYIYYVVKPNTCGEHTFAATAAGFEKARAAYETARQKNGGNAPTKCP